MTVKGLFHVSETSRDSPSFNPITVRNSGIGRVADETSLNEVPNIKNGA
jgi:hypothetical protein